MRRALRHHAGITRTVLFIVLSWACASGTAPAQESGEDLAQWRLGIFGGAVHNHLNAPMQEFIAIPADPSFASRDYAKSLGIAPYGGLVTEYRIDRNFTLALRLAYDDRTVTKTVDGATLTPSLAYLVIEPALRLRIAGGLHVIGGPALGITVHRSYDYATADGVSVEGAALAAVNRMVGGFWAGFEYDIALRDDAGNARWYLAPFIDLSWLFDQKEPDAAGSDATGRWTTGTGRAGITVKLDLTSTADR